MKKTLMGLIIIGLVICTGTIYQMQAEDNQKKEIMQLVNQAVAEIQERGESSFPELRSDKWVRGDIYVFVWRMDGIRVVYPPEPAGEGQNMTELKDYQGKPIGKLFIEVVDEGGGWVEYYWPKPGKKFPSLKLTYIKKVQYQNQTYLVGSGFYK